MTTRYARYALAVIAFANFLSYLDRQLVSALEKSIRTDLLLSGTEFGVLWMLFTIGYMACAPFIGYITDRHRRTRIFAVCIFVWSLATIASGMAYSTWILYPSRLLIGVGEAGCLVIGSSLIADFFGKESRGRALAIFYLGLPVGGASAFIMAGQLEHLVGWRMLFYIAGIPGFLICVLIWLLIDPPRGGSDQQAHAGPKKTSVKEYLELLRTPSLLFVIVAQAFAVFILVPLIHFGVGFFQTARGMDQNEAQNALGIIALIAGVGGILTGGVLGDRLARRYRGAYAAVAGTSFLIGFPALLLGLTTTDRWVFLPAVTVAAFCIFVCMPSVNTHIANVSRPTQRAMAWALAVFILHLLGDTVAPVLFGLVEESIKDPSFKVEEIDPAARESVLSWFTLSLIPATVCCFLAARTAARDEARASEHAPENS